MDLITSMEVMALVRIFFTIYIVKVIALETSICEKYMVQEITKRKVTFKQGKVRQKFVLCWQ